LEYAIEVDLMIVADTMTEWMTTDAEESESPSLSSGWKSAMPRPRKVMAEIGRTGISTPSTAAPLDVYTDVDRLLDFPVNKNAPFVSRDKVMSDTNHHLFFFIHDILSFEELCANTAYMYSMMIAKSRAMKIDVSANKLEPEEEDRRANGVRPMLLDRDRDLERDRDCDRARDRDRDPWAKLLRSGASMGSPFCWTVSAARREHTASTKPHMRRLQKKHGCTMRPSE
jgi:hypothetical protein